MEGVANGGPILDSDDSELCPRKQLTSELYTVVDSPPPIRKASSDCGPISCKRKDAKFQNVPRRETVGAIKVLVALTRATRVMALAADLAVCRGTGGLVSVALSGGNGIDIPRV